MSLWERITSWFRTESAEAHDWSTDLQRDLSSDLDRKEAELKSTPAERMDQLQEQISGNTDTLDEIKGKIGITDPAPAADLDGEPDA